jgi:hypothetical protein
MTDEEGTNATFVNTVIRSVVPRLHAWLNSIDIRESDDIQLPSTEVYLHFDMAPHFGNSETTWLHDRFCQTYLDQWATSSLKQEWQYVFENTDAPLAMDQMKLRRVDGDQLSREIAKRKVSEEKDYRESIAEPSHFVSKALDLLSNGNHVAATTIFDVLCQMNPSSGSAFSNRGFCRIQFDPEAAAKDFDTAEKLGVNNLGKLLVLGNKLLCFNILERNASALEIAENWWEDRSDCDMVGMTFDCYMWDVNSSVPKVVAVKDIRAYICALASIVASKVGNQAQADLWTLRQEQFF